MTFTFFFVKDDINRVYLRNCIFHVGNIRFNCSTFKFQAQKAVFFGLFFSWFHMGDLENKLNAIYKTNQCPFKVDLKTTVHFNSCFPFLVCIPFPMQAVQWKYIFFVFGIIVWTLNDMNYSKAPDVIIFSCNKINPLPKEYFFFQLHQQFITSSACRIIHFKTEF